MVFLGPARQREPVAIHEHVVVGWCHVDSPALDGLAVCGMACWQLRCARENFGQDAPVGANVQDDQHRRLQIRGQRRSELLQSPHAPCRCANHEQHGHAACLSSMTGLSAGKCLRDHEHSGRKRPAARPAMRQSPCHVRAPEEAPPAARRLPF